MRDPLARISVRSKLAIMFVGLSLIAYGLGGFLVSRSAERALEDEILSRLEYQCHEFATALDGSLRLLARRAEDFASDGLIRSSAARLQAARSQANDPAGAGAGAGAGADAGADDDADARGAAAAGDRTDLDALAAELRRHLRENKLPLEPAFANLAVTDADGAVLVAVHADDARRLDTRADDLAAATSLAGERTRVSGILPPVGELGRPGLLLATPLRALDGSRDVGRLLVLVRAEDWVRGAVSALDAGHDEGEVTLILRDRSRRQLVASLGDGGQPGPLRVEPSDAPAETGRVRYAPVRGTFAQSFPVPSSGWIVEVTLDVRDALLPVSGLRSRFIGVGVVLALLSMALLYFPMRFVARPLARMTRAAEQLSRGALETRVTVESNDEIGELGAAFNGMAQAIQERTHRLEVVAAELRDRQAELRTGHDRMQTVISSMHDGLLVLDAEGKVLMSNGAARPLLGLIEKGVIGRSHHVCHDGLGTGPDDAAGIDGPPTESSCFGCLLDVHGPPRSCMVDADARTFEIHTTPLPLDGVRSGGRVLVCRDVTDRIHSDEREIHNERLAVLGEVAAVVAHELNNPLASISMFNQMLAADLPTESPLRENTDVIGRNTDAAKRTIRELLDYATGATPEVGPMDVHATLEDVARFLRPLSERAGVAVRLDLGARASEVTGDEVQLRQMFVNLVMNGIQAVARGPDAAGGAVTCTTRDDGDRLVVDVSDTGSGIAPEDRERIFRPFFTTKSRGEGTGLGLSTTRRLAEMHGGSLALVGSSQAGTVFRVRLRPRAAAPVVENPVVENPAVDGAVS